MESARDFAPFSGLDEPMLRRALAAGEERSVRTDKALWYQGDTSSYCCITIAGAVRTIMYRADESTLDLGLFGPGDWLGTAELILSGPCACDAVAAEPCRLLAYAKTGFDRLLGLPGMERWFLGELARRQYALYSRVELSRPQDRLARHLASLAAPGSSRVTCTQEELAESIGATRETVNRNLGRMQEEGLIRVGRGLVEILDRNGLEGKTP
ncbi:MAG: Crp/Fnr family transcriptional regulator [Spirochaetes bacterium]|nr:Crp/Fnr family transcriptional regulator [Spirochaetota bacterium]